jgi:hypothetical protein
LINIYPSVNSGCNPYSATVSKKAYPAMGRFYPAMGRFYPAMGHFLLTVESLTT